MILSKPLYSLCPHSKAELFIHSFMNTKRGIFTHTSIHLLTQSCVFIHIQYIPHEVTELFFLHQAQWKHLWEIFHIIISSSFAAAMYYGYYMLPDGTFCLAPPPPGIDASSYYNNIPSAVMAPTTSSGALPHVGTTPTPPETIAMAPPATAPTQVTSSAAPATIPETR